MYENCPTFRYRVSDSSGVNVLSAFIDPMQLPAIAMLNVDQKYPRFPYIIPLQQRIAYLQKITDDGPTMLAAHEAYLNMRSSVDEGYWTLPLFYFADNNNFFGISQKILLPGKTINPHRAIETIPEEDVVQKARNILAIYNAIRYLQSRQY